MPYNFKLAFTGLCVFTFKGDKNAPKEVNSLLVDTRHHGGGHHGAHRSRPDPDRHLPYLSYDPRNLQRRPKPSHRLVPSPDSTQIALQDLTGKALEIVLPEGVTRPLIAQWRPLAIPDLPDGPSGNDPAEEEWLDWTMALQRMNPKDPKTPDPTNDAPYAGLKGDKVIARVRIVAVGTP